MTDQEIQVAIAEECEFLNIHSLDGIWFGRHKKSLEEDVWPLPDYPNDLNAMHEAEKLLSSNEAVKFRLQLSHNSDGANAKFPTVESAMCHATARQRAEAFLRTIGKWKE